jgi:hypothetical protein
LLGYSAVALYMLVDRELLRAQMLYFFKHLACLAEDGVLTICVICNPYMEGMEQSGWLF